MSDPVQSTDGQAPQTSGPVFVSGFVDPDKRRLVLIAAVLGSAMGFIDGTVVPIAIPAIRATIGASLSEAIWINNAYMVVLSALILTGGALGDRFGLGRVFSFGIWIFMVTSLICAIAPTPELLILARFAQGFGAALMVPGSLSIVSRAYPRELRGAAIGTWAAASAVTTALGPILGGLALALGGDAMWRLLFAINIPLGFLALYLIKRGISEDTARPGDPVDFLGAILATVGLGLLAWALTHSEHGQMTPTVWAAYAAGAIVIVIFIIHERLSPHAMMPLWLFKSAPFSAANLVTFALYFGLSAILFFLPMLVIAGWGIAEIFAAAALAPLSIFIMALSRYFSGLAARVGHGVMIGTGSVIVACAYFWLSFAVETRLFWAGVLPPMTLGGFGMSMVVAPLSTVVMGSVGDDQTGAASGINNAISRIAGLVAVAAMSAVVSRAYLAAGGPVSYGVSWFGEDHAVAMVAAFAAVARVAAALSVIAAVFSFALVRTPKT